MISKEQVKKYIDNYCKKHQITITEYDLCPLYIHLNGFSHSMGFTKHAVKKGERATDYTSVGYSGYMSSSERNIWGYTNEHQRNIAYELLSMIPHYCYQHNPKEILF
jgi:hypothetical protein